MALPCSNCSGLIPQLSVVMIEKGCTGMAGTFGIAAANFDKSIEIGAGLIQEMKSVDAAAG
jgi:Fe-S oxidoreductase